MTKVYVVLAKGKVCGVYTDKHYADVVHWFDNVEIAEIELDKPIDAKFVPELDTMIKEEWDNENKDENHS
jgi:hypothetical protein